MDTKATTSERPTCFVVMPIADAPGYDSGHFGRVYEHLLKPAILQAGYNPIRADDTTKTDYIVVGIIKKIIDSEMVLCDYSAKNPNVMYELGIRHAFNKPVVLIKDRRTDRIFDIQGLRYVEYDDTLRVDSVAKDIQKISSAVEETAKAGPDELNSVVQLAGVISAEVPEGRAISMDTQLLLDAINSVSSRIGNLEDGSSYQDKLISEMHSKVGFFVTDKGVELSNGDIVGVGDYVYRKGEALGRITMIDGVNQTFTIQARDRITRTIRSIVPWASEIDTIPF